MGHPSGWRWPLGHMGLMESPSGEGQWQGPREQWESRQCWHWERPRGHEAPAGCPAHHRAPSSGARSGGMCTERQDLCNIKPPSAQSLHGLRALSSHFCPHRWSGARDWDPQVSPRLCRCGCGGPAPHAAPLGQEVPPFTRDPICFPCIAGLLTMLSKSRSWYHFRDGTHTAPGTHPAARVLIQRRVDMAGR